MSTSLPEHLYPYELRAVDPEESFMERLKAAAVVYDYGASLPDDDPMKPRCLATGASYALRAVLDYLRHRDVPAELVAPLTGLVWALGSLESNSLPIMFRFPRKRGRGETPLNRVAWRAVAAAAMELRYRDIRGKNGDASLEMAARWVASRLSAWPGKRPSWKDVKRWRDEAMQGSSEDLLTAKYRDLLKQAVELNDEIPASGSSIAEDFLDAAPAQYR